MQKQIFAIFLACFMMTSALRPQQEDNTLALSLEDAIIQSLDNNLGAAVQVLNPELAEISMDIAKEKFMPLLSFNFSKRDSNSPSYSFLDSSDLVSTASDNYAAQISQLLPTGGNFSLSLDGYKTDTNRRFQTINPRFGSTLTFNFSQPLLKNFGIKITRREVVIAQNNWDISENNFKKSIQDLVYTVEEAYWNLVYSIENLKVKRQSLKLARDLLDKNKRAVEVGTLAPIEILSAEADVATREADILEAEALVKNHEDNLKAILNLSAQGKEKEALEIVPVDTPTYEKISLELDETLLTALENRPDLQATRIDLKNRKFNVDYARNQLLPDLSLQASYWSPGISGSQILFLNNDPLSGIVVGSLPGGAGEALEDAFNFKYKNWSVGLTLTMPLNSLFSRASYAQAKVNLEQSLLQLKNQEQQIVLEIKNVVRAVQTNYKRVAAYKAARELAEKKLEAEEQKLKVGLSTNYFVLQYQRDLANAQIMELKALVDYNLSLARLDRALGVSLQKKNISFSKILAKAPLFP